MNRVVFTLALSVWLCWVTWLKWKEVKSPYYVQFTIPRCIIDSLPECFWQGGEKLGEKMQQVGWFPWTERRVELIPGGWWRHSRILSTQSHSQKQLIRGALTDQQTAILDILIFFSALLLTLKYSYELINNNTVSQCRLEVKFSSWCCQWQVSVGVTDCSLHYLMSISDSSEALLSQYRVWGFFHYEVGGFVKCKISESRGFVPPHPTDWGEEWKFWQRTYSHQ